MPVNTFKPHGLRVLCISAWHIPEKILVGQHHIYSYSLWQIHAFPADTRFHVEQCKHAVC